MPKLRIERLPWIVIVSFGLFTVPGDGLAMERATLNAALSSITRLDLGKHVDVLADDTFEGRESGARGGHAAGGYIVRKLQELSLKPAGDGGSYYQTFNGNARNILAIVEGSDPALKNEIIVLGGHYDHVGYGSQRNSYGPWGYIHNGADDNASGVAGLLEVAEALQQLAQPPRRSILLAFWDGEEKGLLGSKHWVAAPTIAWSRVKCMVNVDMIGRLTNRKVEVYGSRSAPGLRELVSVANDAKLDLDFTWKMKEDSDHWPFFAKSVPVLMFHTGLHADYHRPSDDAERINREGLEQVTRLVCESTFALANADSLGVFRPESRRENNDTRRFSELPIAAPAARLGMTWRKTLDATGDIKLNVISVTPRSAADLAGIRVGDAVTRLDGAPILDDGLFRRQVAAAEQSILLTAVGTNGNKRECVIRLQGEPNRTGLIVRDDRADPGVVVIQHVVYGSAAEIAGLQVNDRVYDVNGQQFRTAAEFQKLATGAHNSLTMQRERRGSVVDVTLQLVPVAPPSP